MTNVTYLQTKNTQYLSLVLIPQFKYLISSSKINKQYIYNFFSELNNLETSIFAALDIISNQRMSHQNLK